MIGFAFGSKAPYLQLLEYAMGEETATLEGEKIPVSAIKSEDVSIDHRPVRQVFNGTNQSEAFSSSFQQRDSTDYNNYLTLTLRFNVTGEIDIPAHEKEPVPVGGLIGDRKEDSGCFSRPKRKPSLTKKI